MRKKKVRANSERNFDNRPVMTDERAAEYRTHLISNGFLRPSDIQYAPDERPFMMTEHVKKLAEVYIKAGFLTRKRPSTIYPLPAVMPVAAYNPVVTKIIPRRTQ